MSVADLSGKLGLDTTDFRTAIAAANRELRVIESGFRASAAALGDWGKSMDGLEQRTNALTRSIGLQESKVGALADEYARIASEQGEGSRAAQDMLIRLNKETETLNKMRFELSGTQRGLDEMRRNSDRTGKSVEDMARKKSGATKTVIDLRKTIAGLGSVLKTAVAGFGALGAAAVNATRKAASAALSLGRSVASAASRIASSVALLAVGAAVAITGLLASTIKPASDLAETANKIAVVFEDSADAVNRFAADAAIGFGMTRQAVLDAAATFGVFGRSAGLTGEDLSDFSTELVGLSADLASFYNTTPEEAAEALGAALRGQSEPMRRYGVLLDEATLRQKAFELGIIKTTKTALTPQQRVLAAQAVVMEQAAVAQGDFARTSAGLANQQRILRAQIGNLRTTIGTGLLPVVTAGYQMLTRLLASDKIQKGAENLSKGFGAIGEAISATFAGERAEAISRMVDGISGLAQTFGVADEAAQNFALNTVAFFQRILDKIGEVRQGFATGGITGGLGAMLEPLREISPLFDAVGGAIERVIGYFDQFLQVISGADGDMAKMGDGLGNLISTIFTDMFKGRGNLADAAVGLIGGLADGIVNAIPVLIPIAASVIEQLLSFIVTALPGLLESGAKILMTLIDGLVKQLPQLATAAVGIVMTLIKGILPMLPQLLRAALQIVISLARGITQALPELIPAIVAIITEMLLILTENYPLLIDAGVQLLTALLQGIIQALPTLLEQAPVIVESLLSGILAAAPVIATAAGEMIAILITGIVAALPELARAAVRIVTSLGDYVRNMLPTMLKVGENIVLGIWEGIAGRADWFGEQIKSFFTNIIDGVKDALGIQSPSDIFAGIGSNMVRGMTPAMSTAGARISNVQQQTTNYYAPVYNIQTGGKRDEQKARRW